MKRAFAIGAALASALYALTAHAELSDGERLFREGRAAMSTKDYALACAKFRESLEQEPAPGTALNLGECEEQRGHLVAAADAFTAAATTFKSQEKQRYAQSRADAVEKRVCRVSVHVQNTPSDLVLRINGKQVPVDTAARVDPGDIVVQAESTERRPFRKIFSLVEGRSLDMIVALESLTPDGDAAVAALPKSQPRTSLRPMGLVVAGVGAAGLVVGTVTGIMTLGKANAVKDNCGPALSTCDAQGLDEAKAGQTLATVSTVSVVAGGALVIGGGLLYFLSPRSANTTGRMQVVPDASVTSASVLFRGTF